LKWLQSIFGLVWRDFFNEIRDYEMQHGDVTAKHIGVTAKYTGHVKWFNDAKGFGFIQSEGKDYFVHFKEIRKEGFKSLAPDQKVQFSIGQSVKGPIATDVQLVD
jgi:cold shock protein